MKRHTLLALLLALPTAALADSGSASREEVPMGIPTEGYLLDSNSQPVTGQASITFTLWDSPTGGAVKWSDTRAVDVYNGHYAVVLGDPLVPDAKRLTADALATPRFLGVTIGGGQELQPRLEVGSVPYAVQAMTAHDLTGGTVTNATITGSSVDATSVSIGGTKVIDESGQFLGTANNATHLDGQPAIAFLTKTGDGSGLTNLSPQNIAPGTANIDISGNAATATSAENAASFTGKLAGDVNGPQTATVVTGLQNVPIAPTAPTATDLLRFDATLHEWVPGPAQNGELAGPLVTSISPGDGLRATNPTGVGGASLALALDGATLANGANGLRLNLASANDWTGAQQLHGGATVSTVGDATSLIVQQSSVPIPTQDVLEVRSADGRKYLAIGPTGDVSFSGSVTANSFAGSLSPTLLSGGTASIDISGNAATVTNGVYTSQSYADPAWLSSIAGSKVAGDIAGKASNVAGIVAIANGGTGASNAGDALANLGAATRGANGDITSLAGLTTALPVAEGGTGALSADGARLSLQAAQSGANGDITSLTGLTTALSVTEGGTGAQSADGARLSLQAAQSGANGDITSLTGLTTALPVTEGGTGVKAVSNGDLLVGATGNGFTALAGPSAPGQVLRSTGTSAFSWGPIATTDLPTGIPSADLDHSSLTITTSSASGLAGGGTVALGGSLSLSVPTGGVSNSMLANDSVTINAGVGLGGGGTVTLGGAAIALTANLAHDATLTGNGGSSSFGINLANANTWAGTQTFASATITNLTFINTAHGSIDGNAARVTNGVYTNSANTLTGVLALEPNGGAAAPLTVNAGSGQTGDLTDWQVNSSTVASLSASGNLTLDGLTMKNGASPNAVLTSDASGNAIWSSSATLSGLTLTSRPAIGDVLTSDASGNATWQPPMFRTVQVINGSTLVPVAVADQGTLFEITADNTSIDLPDASNAGAGFSVSVKSLAQQTYLFPMTGQNIDGDTYAAVNDSGTVVSDGTRWIAFGRVVGTNQAEADFLAPGAYTWTVPQGVTSVSVVVIGGGGGGAGGSSAAGGGGGGGGLCYATTLSVTPGTAMTVDVGGGGVNGNPGAQSDFSGIIAYGGLGASGLTGGNGRSGSTTNCYAGGGGGSTNNWSYGAGGGGAAGYSGNGGAGGAGSSTSCPTGGSGGIGGGGGGGGGSGSGAATVAAGYLGGGVGLHGFGMSGSGGTENCGTGGSVGGSGSASGTAFGGGGRGAPDFCILGSRCFHQTGGGGGAVRIIWGTGRSFPYNAN